MSLETEQDDLEMRCYIRLNLVKAVPRNNATNGIPGYDVYYEDGYISWCPKDTFERVSREITAREMKHMTGKDPDSWRDDPEGLAAAIKTGARVHETDEDEAPKKKAPEPQPKTDSNGD